MNQQIKSAHEYLEFDAPCCESVRECSVRRIYIIGFRNSPKVLREIKAVRCHRGLSKKVRFYPSNDVVLISYYRSNRGVHYVTVLWKPENLAEKDAIELAKKALGLSLEETIRFE